MTTWEIFKIVMALVIAVVCLIVNIRIMRQMCRKDILTQKAIARRAIRNCVIAILIIICIGKLQ